MATPEVKGLTIRQKHLLGGAPSPTLIRLGLTTGKQRAKHASAIPCGSTKDLSLTIQRTWWIPSR